MTHRSFSSDRFLPARGRVIVTISVLDENGFTRHHAPVETGKDVLARVLQTLFE